MTPRKMVKACGLKDTWIAARPASQSNGTYFVSQNSPIVLSNCFKTGILKHNYYKVVQLW
jgi:hypothetical protein